MKKETRGRKPFKPKKRGRKPGVTFDVVKKCTCGKRYKYPKCYWACLKSHIRDRNKKGIIGLFKFVAIGETNPDIEKAELMILNENIIRTNSRTNLLMMADRVARDPPRNVSNFLINPNSIYLKFIGDQFNLMSRILKR